MTLSQKPFEKKVRETLFSILTKVPESTEQVQLEPEVRVQQLINSATWRAAAASGVLALPSGFFGMLTLLPDLVLVWKIQAKLVADIAAVHGKSKQVNRDTLMYCLFSHGQSNIQDIAVRTGERFLVRRSTVQAFRKMSERVGLKVMRRFLGEGFARWIPVVGALSVGRYAKLDTEKVGATARELFRYEIEEDENLH